MDTNTAAELVTLMQLLFVAGVFGLPALALAICQGLKPPIA